MAFGSATFMPSISFTCFDFSIRQASLSSLSTSRIRHRFPSARRLNFQYPSASQRFGCFNSRRSITNTDVQLGHVTTAEVPIESSTVEPDCLVPLVKLNSDVLETEPVNQLTEATYVDCLDSITISSSGFIRRRTTGHFSYSCAPSWIVCFLCLLCSWKFSRTISKFCMAFCHCLVSPEPFTCCCDGVLQQGCHHCWRSLGWQSYGPCSNSVCI